MRNRILLWSALLCCSLSQAARPGEDEQPRPEDVKLLQAAGVATDGPGLLEFFRKKSPTHEQGRQIEELIQQLSSMKYKVREQATKQLIALGHTAVAHLTKALQHTDCEVVARAQQCLKVHKANAPGELLSAAVRVLAARQPPQVVEVLLSFLPHAADPDVEDEIARALAVITAQGKADPLLVQALTAKLPLVRAAAGGALARSGLPEHREAVRKLLDDPQPSVRLQVCLALICAGDKEAVKALINLEGPWCQIRSVCSGKVLDVPNASKDQLVQIHLWDHQGALKEQWSVEKWRNYWVIRSRCSGLVLDVAYDRMNDGAMIIQYPHVNGHPGQLWELVPVK